MDVAEAFVRNLERAEVGRGDRIGLAVSGGADSTALLHLTAGLAPRLDLRPHVLHVDHALRHDSRADALAVAADAETLRLPWSILRAPVRRFPRQSVEAQARDVRYLVLDRAARELECRFVLTAHTLDDQAETVLLRAFRGTGPSGLAGIAARRGRFVRPLLDARGAALRDWLASRGISWREDATNEDVVFERNWVRREVMPLLEARRPGAAVSLARLAELARQDADVLEAMAQERFTAVSSRRAGTIILREDVFHDPPAVGGRVILRALAEAGSSQEWAAVDMVRALAQREPGAVVVCPGRVQVWRMDGEVVFVPGAGAAPRPVRLPSEGVIESDEWGVRVRVLPAGSATEPAWRWRFELENVLPDGLWLRSRRPGDRVRTARGTKKVQDVLVDAKVPRFARDSVPVLTDGERPLAVVGLTRPPRSGTVRVIVDIEPRGERWWNRTKSRATS